MKIIHLFLILFAFITIKSELISDEYSEKLQLIKHKINQNYYTFDYSALRVILNDAAKLEKEQSSWQLDYYSGMLNLLMGKIIYNRDKDAAYSHFDSSIIHFESSYNNNKSAEIAALLSSAYGKKSSLSIINAFFLGMKAKNWIYKANDLTKNSPKINLIAATHLMHLPEFYGGDKEKAELLLKKSLKIEAQNENEWCLKWGEAPELYAYLAQLEVLRNNEKQADYYIKKALEYIPEYGFIKYDLKNQLKNNNK